MGLKKYLLGCSLLLASLSGAVTMASMPTGVLPYSGDAVTPPGFVMMVDDTSEPQYMVYMRQYPVGADEQNPYTSQSYNYAGMQSYTPATNEAIPTNALKDLLISSNGTSTWVVSGDIMYDPGNRSDRVYDATDAGDGDYNLMTVHSAGDSQQGPYLIANSFNTNRQNKIRTIYTTYYTPPDTSLTGHIARCGTNSGSINISEQECIGLAYLYDEAGGASWTNNNGWFSNTDVSLWESSSCYSPVDGDDFCSSIFSGPELRRGVALTGSNVTGGAAYTVYGINLPDNNLVGAITTGFAYFSNLVIADVQDNHLTSVDVSHNPLLRELDISDQDSNPTSWTTDFTHNPALRSLNIDGLKFYDVDLSTNTALEYLDADSNHLSGINLSGLNVLRSVDLSYNNFSDWDADILIPSPVLHDLDVSNNAMTQIDLSDMLSLVEFYASDNGLTSITLGELPNLNTLDVSNNELSEINLSGVYNLHDLDVHYNNLSTLDIGSTEHMEVLDASSNQLTQFIMGDIEEHNSLHDISIAYNGLCYIEDQGLIDFFNDRIGEGWGNYQFFCAPRDVTGTINSDHATTLTWRAPANSANDDGDATPLHYTVAMIGGTGEYQVNNETFSYDFAGLTNGTTYFFRVCAVHGNEGPNRTACETISVVPGGETGSPEPTHGGGGGGSVSRDSCPNGDTSPSYYDDSCGNDTAVSSGDNNQANEDKTVLCLDPEYQTAYLFSLKYHITTMPTCIDANMDGLLLRSQAAKMMANYAINVLGKTPDNTKVCDFSDMSNESPEMQQYAIAACRLGIMGLEFDGVTPSTKFNPNATVDKAQFATILDRLINGRAHDGNDACRYCDHVSALQDAGVITVTTDLFDPLQRAFAMIMLMRTKKTSHVIVQEESSRIDIDK